MLGASLVQASDAELLRCRQITDASQRLRCYDALPVVAPAAPAAAVAPTRPTGPTPDNFGLEGRGIGTRVEAIETSIVGNFDEWGPNYRFNLANGQVWQVVDGSIGFRASSDSRVKIRRGMLGTFYLELVGTNRSPKVQRVQ